MTLLRICWAVDVITLVVGLYFLVDGLADEKGDYEFYAVSFCLLAPLVGSLLGSYWLLQEQHPRWALLLAAVPAVLAALVGLWMGLLWVLYKPGGNMK